MKMNIVEMLLVCYAIMLYFQIQYHAIIQ